MRLPTPKFEGFSDGIMVTIYYANGETRAGTDGANTQLDVGDTVGKVGDVAGEKLVNAGDIKKSVLKMITQSRM